MNYLLVIGLLILVIAGYIIARHYISIKQYEQKQKTDETLYQNVLKNIDRRLSVTDSVSRFALTSYEQTLRSIKNTTHFPLTENDRIKILTTGVEKYPVLHQSIAKAKHHIHVLYYTIKDDQTGQQLINLLIKKAQEGIEIRLLVDGLGSKAFSESKEYKRCQQAGIKCATYAPAKIHYLLDFNFRNHRKIVVIDGRIGFTGGLNIGDEYVHKDKSKGYWRDIHMLIEGEAVLLLQRIFATDWYYVFQEKLTEDHAYFPQYTEEGTHQNQQDTALVQVIPSGPDMKKDTIKNALKEIIDLAQRKVWLGTPYFIPDQTVMDALINAVRRGIEVILVVPKRTDNPLVHFASQHYFDTLIRSGIKVYCYEKRFYHSKIALIDDQISMVGSANFDKRSFHYNFEAELLIYQQETSAQMEHIFTEDIQNSYLLQTKQIHNRPVWQKAATILCLPLSQWL